MKKHRAHLTPEEVQEFHEMGVVFGETACVWCENKHGYELQEAQEGYAKIDLYENIEDWDIKSITTAPNLQEVLEVLPKNIKMGDEDFMLNILFAPHSWYFNYRSWLDNSECTDYITDENPLIAAVKQLRWLCNNHPETLTKK